MQTKSHLILSLSLLLLACQGPPGPAEPPQPIVSPVAPAPTTVPSEPAPGETPQPTPEPQPTPVQRVEVEDITPPEFLTQNQGSIYGLTVDNDSSVPRLFLNYGSPTDPDKSYSGLWAFREGQSAERLLAAYRTANDDFNSMQYYAQGLYILETENQRRCLRHYTLDKLEQPETVLCQIADKALQAFKITDSGQIFVYGRFQPEGISDARSTTYHVSEVKHGGLQTHLISNPVGVSKILVSSSTIDPIKCFGICFQVYHPGQSALTFTLFDFEKSRYYTVRDYFKDPFAYVGSVNSDVPDNEKLLLLKDGSSDEVTFWRPSGLDVDQQGHVYIKEDLAEESLIRRVNFETRTETLISANGLSDFGYPQSLVNLKALLPDAIKSSGKAEEIAEYIVDTQRDWLYILGLDLYRFDLRTEKLEYLGNSVGRNLNIDSQGHLYTTLGNRVYKILIPQPENR